MKFKFLTMYPQNIIMVGVLNHVFRTKDDSGNEKNKLTALLAASLLAWTVIGPGHSSHLNSFIDYKKTSKK